MPQTRHPLRSHVLALFKRGELVSVGEAVLICGASRQAVHKWLKAEGINIEARRMAHLAKLRTRAEHYLEGKPPLRRPTKVQMRKQLKQAIERFNAANAPADRH